MITVFSLVWVTVITTAGLGIGAYTSLLADRSCTDRRLRICGAFGPKQRTTKKTMLSDLKAVAAQWGIPKPARPDAPVEPDPQQNPELAYDLAQQMLQRQLDSADVLDTKVNNAFTAAVALMALSAAVLALRTGGFTGASLHWFYASLVPALLIAALCGFGTLARRWRTGPKVAPVVSQYRHGVDEAAVKWKVVRSLIGSTEINHSILVVKQAVHRACYFLLLAEVAAVIMVLISLAQKT